MLSQLIKKEILEHMMSLRFGIACILCLTVVLCSLFVRGRDYTQVLDDYHHDLATYQNELERLDHPWRLVWDGFNQKVHLAPNPLKVFVNGIDSRNGGVTKLPHLDDPIYLTGFLTNTSVPLFTSIDLVTFVGIIMSLLAIVFGYDAVCGEKERGTLRLMLSYSVPRVRVLLGKWIGGYIALMLPLLIVLLGAFAILLLQRGIALTADEWVRLLAVIGVGSLYIAAIYSMAIWISTTVSKSSTSIMLLITIWVVLILAIPNLSPYVAGFFKPVSNPLEIASDGSRMKKDLWQAEVEDKMDDYDKRTEFSWDKVNWRGDPSSRVLAYKRWLFESDLMYEARQAIFRGLEKISQNHRSEVQSQLVLSQWLSRLSPYSCFAMASAELTDTGVSFKSRLDEQIRRYRVEMMDYGKSEYVAYTNRGIEDNGKDQPPWIEVREHDFPRFQYERAVGFENMISVMIDAGILLALVGIFFMLSFMNFIRYDVR